MNIVLSDREEIVYFASVPFAAKPSPFAASLFAAEIGGDGAVLPGPVDSFSIEDLASTVKAGEQLDITVVAKLPSTGSWPTQLPRLVHAKFSVVSKQIISSPLHYYKACPKKFLKKEKAEQNKRHQAELSLEPRRPKMNVPDDQPGA